MHTLLCDLRGPEYFFRPFFISIVYKIYVIESPCITHVILHSCINNKLKDMRGYGMKLVFIPVPLLFVMLSVSGCSATEVQEGKLSKSSSVSEINRGKPPSHDIRSTEEKIQPIENQFGLTEVFSVGVQEVCDCAMQVLKERGEYIFKQEMETGITITGSRFIMSEELRRIAFLPQQDAIQWTKGNYNLRLLISSSSEKTTTITIVVRILGYGETSLPLLRPSPWWTLPSKGVVEHEIFTAILHCCQKKNK